MEPAESPGGPDHRGPTVAGHDLDDPTSRLWMHRSRRSAAIQSAAALTGIPVATLAEATAISLAASDEARVLLDGMEHRIRTLPTTVVTSSQRCVNSVRGPILWAETITARANALGNDDVFVCMTSQRSFDRIENQLLVDALTSIASAARAIDGPLGERVEEQTALDVRRVATEAARWRGDSRLAGIRPARLTGRTAAHIRGGHRRSSMGPVLAVRQRASEPFAPEDLTGLADVWTRRLHGTVLRVLDAMEPPHVLTLSDGGLWCRTLSFRHPATAGPGPAGLAVRGTPVLPPADDVDGAPWADLLPTDGVRIPADCPPERISELLGQSRSSSQ